MGTLRRDWLYLLVGGRSSVRKKFHKGSKLEMESRRMRMISPSIFYLKMFTCLFNGFSDPTFALTPSSWQLCDLYESIKTVSSLLKLFDGFPVKLKWNLNPFDSLQGPTWCICVSLSYFVNHFYIHRGYYMNQKLAFIYP